MVLSEEELLQSLVDEAARLVEAVRGCDLSAPVPGLAWDARTVATHTGAVHRWAADIVARALPSNETGGSDAFFPDGLDDAELPAWLERGAASLVTVLSAAPAGLRCFTFIPGVAPRLFWIRRQAHETAIHRVDLEGAAGRPVTPVDPSFAQDGLDELVGSFATEPAFAVHRPGRLLLAAADGPDRMVTFGGERTHVATGDLIGAAADAIVRGSSDELYRWAWNRPSTALETGDPDTLAAWRQVRVQ